MQNLRTRISTLERANGGVETFEEFLARTSARYGPAWEQAMKGAIAGGSDKEQLMVFVAELERRSPDENEFFADHGYWPEQRGKIECPR